MSELTATTKTDMPVKRLKDTPLGYPRFSAACLRCGKRRSMDRQHYYDPNVWGNYAHRHSFYCCGDYGEWEEKDLLEAFPNAPK